MAKQVLVEDKKAEELRLKNEKKERGALYRRTVKVLAVYCTEMMPGTNYDRFYVDELVKKYPGQEKLEEFIVKVKAISVPAGDEFVHEFLMLVDAKAYQLKLQKAKENEEKQAAKKLEAQNVRGDWTSEELEMF